ncbi:MAG: hypothetical protein RL625_1025 [Gemmatimonadota bacterium]
MTLPMTSRTLAALGAALVLSACGIDLETTAVQDITAPADGGYVRFFNFASGAGAASAAPSVNFYAGDTKVTAINSATGVEAASGVAYGGVGNGGLYSNLKPGPYTFAGRIIGAPVDNGLPISQIAATVAPGKYYSVYQSGLYDAVNKVSDGFVVEDPIPAAFDFSQAYIRFVHASSNSNAMTLTVTNTVSTVAFTIGEAIGYKKASGFSTVPAGTYNIAGACGTTCNSTGAGNATTAVTRTGITVSAGRYYTIALRGDVTLNPATTTLANRLQFDFSANR